MIFRIHTSRTSILKSKYLCLLQNKKEYCNHRLPTGSRQVYEENPEISLASNKIEKIINDQPSQTMAVLAQHVARKVNIEKLFQQLYFKGNYSFKHYIFKDSIVLQLFDLEKKNVVSDVQTNINPNGLKENVTNLINRNINISDDHTTFKQKTILSKDKWIVYFDYGGIVFFNFDTNLAEEFIEKSKKYCDNIIDNSIKTHKAEKMMLVCDPHMNKWSDLNDNSISVQKIDHINIHVIAGVLAQTVALEYYEQQVEVILAEFEKLNKLVESKGPNTAFGLKYWGLFWESKEKKYRDQLFRIVATNNSLLIDIVNKLRILDRKRPGDAAWNFTRYHNMWENLLADFEINERFDNLNFKLTLIQQNTKFFLEVLGTHKSERMEGYIIFLIALELAVSLADFYLHK